MNADDDKTASFDTLNCDKNFNLDDKKNVSYNFEENVINFYVLLFIIH